MLLWDECQQDVTWISKTLPLDKHGLCSSLFTSCSQLFDDDDDDDEDDSQVRLFWTHGRCDPHVSHRRADFQIFCFTFIQWASLKSNEVRIVFCWSFSHIGWCSSASRCYFLSLSTESWRRRWYLDTSSGELLLLSFTVDQSNGSKCESTTRESVRFHIWTEPFCLFLLILIFFLLSSLLFRWILVSSDTKLNFTLWYKHRLKLSSNPITSLQPTLHVPLSNLPLKEASHQRCDFISFVPPSLR